MGFFDLFRPKARQPKRPLKTNPPPKRAIKSRQNETASYRPSSDPTSPPPWERGGVIAPPRTVRAMPGETIDPLPATATANLRLPAHIWGRAAALLGTRHDGEIRLQVEAGVITGARIIEAVPERENDDA